MLLVYGPRSVTYDFGPAHPLTPRRFAPGHRPAPDRRRRAGLAPEPAPDEELLWCHEARYLETVKRLSAPPFGPPGAGIGQGGDDPPFAGMHDAGAAVAGGSLRAVEAILRGDDEHAFHPGGGLHHAMPDHASGFCIYDDPALAIARARRDGLRVLYLDFDVHHGDGVQAIHWDDPGVLTVSFHESGHYLFPGSGFLDELGEGTAAGTAVNVPMEPETGEGAWLDAVQLLVPELAAAFGPDLVVSQHGADSHAWDPLAHLRMTTTAMGEAARLVDTRRPSSCRRPLARDRWRRLRRLPRRAADVEPGLARRRAPRRPVRDRPDVARTVGGGRRPSSGSRRHRPRSRTHPNAGLPFDWSQESAETRSRAVAQVARLLTVPRLLWEARDRGWWHVGATGSGRGRAADDRWIADDPRRTSTRRPGTGWPSPRASSRPPIRERVTRSSRPRWPMGRASRPRRSGSTVIGLGVTSADGDLLALGVAPSHRRRGVADALLAVSPATTGRGHVGRARSGRAARSGDAGRGRPAAPRTRRLPRGPGRRADRRGGPDGHRGRAMSLPARDIVDVRLSAAIDVGGCPICVVRARSERAMLDSIIAEHVLDIPFRGDLERKKGFCRRHLARADRGRPPGDRRHPRVVDPVRRDARAAPRGAPRRDREPRSRPPDPARRRAEAPAVHRLRAGCLGCRDGPGAPRRTESRRGLGGRDRPTPRSASTTSSPSGPWPATTPASSRSRAGSWTGSRTSASGSRGSSTTPPTIAAIG